MNIRKIGNGTKGNANWNSKSIRIAAAFSLAAVAAIGTAYGGVPLNNLQGTGGIAFNPLAYTAGLPWEYDSVSNLNGIVSAPQFGAWYVNLNDADINWYAGSAALTFFDRLEVSYGYGFINARKYGDKSIETHNIGAKFRFLDENSFDTAWVPALAVGGVWKYTDSKTVDALGLDDNGYDAYVVASKLITQAPAAGAARHFVGPGDPHGRQAQHVLPQLRRAEIQTAAERPAGRQNMV